MITVNIKSDDLKPITGFDSANRDFEYSWRKFLNSGPSPELVAFWREATGVFEDDNQRDMPTIGFGKIVTQADIDASVRYTFRDASSYAACLLGVGAQADYVRRRVTEVFGKDAASRVLIPSKPAAELPMPAASGNRSHLLGASPWIKR